MRVLLVVYDNGSYIHDFPLGLAYLAAVLRREGIEVTIYQQDINHYPEDHLRVYLDQNKFDIVGVGAIGGYYQYRKLLSISKAVNASVQRPFYILGGHGPAPEPEYFLRKTGADVVVLGEAEETIVELVNAVASHTSLAGIKGIAFMNEGKFVLNERRPVIEDIDAIPFPAYDLFDMKHYRLLRGPHADKADFTARMIAGRGCTFKCNFCYRMDPGFRTRSHASIVEEVTYLQKDFDITYVAFMDELLMGSIEWTEGLCQAFLKAGLKLKWNCNGRLNYAKPKLLKLMRQAGCVFINYGIEAMDDQVLKNMNKVLTTKQIISGVEATLAAGISPGYNILFGNIGDNKETLRKGVEFLLKYDDGAQMRTIRPVTPYPGSPLYYYALKKGLLKDCQDFYENKHLNSDLVAVNFTEMSDDEMHEALLEANKVLIENYYSRSLSATIKAAENLYLKKDSAFRGFRQT